MLDYFIYVRGYVDIMIFVDGIIYDYDMVKFNIDYIVFGFYLFKLYVVQLEF